MAESQSADVENGTNDAPTVEELAAELDDLRSEVVDATQSARTAKRNQLDLREELQAKDERIAELEDCVAQQQDIIEELQDRTDMLETVKKASSMKIDQRAAVLIQVLYNKAWSRGRKTNEEPRAALDYNDASNALGGCVGRSTIYRTMTKAEQLVDDTDVLQKIKEDRSSSKNTRLALDLTEGDLPSRVDGHVIESPEEI